MDGETFYDGSVMVVDGVEYDVTKRVVPTPPPTHYAVGQRVRHKKSGHTGRIKAIADYADGYGYPRALIITFDTAKRDDQLGFPTYNRIFFCGKDERVNKDYDLEVIDCA